MKSSASTPRLIHFFGPDGAGKSTQVNILVDFLNQHGMRVKKCWVRSPHTVAFVLWRFFVRIGFYREISNPFGITVKIPAVDRNRVLRSFWVFIEFFSVIPLVVRSYIYMLLGYTLVAERYLLDTVTTVAFFVNNEEFANSVLSRLFFSLIPRSTIYVFLDSDFETIYRRRAPLFFVEKCRKNQNGEYGVIPQAAVEPRAFIDFQRVCYRKLAYKFPSLKIDTSNSSIKETSDAIFVYLGLSQ